MQFNTVLFLIFLVLKLCGVIAWSWWWVTCPLWIVFVLSFLGIVTVGGAVSKTFKKREF